MSKCSVRQRKTDHWKYGCGQRPSQCCYNKVCSRERVQVCHTSISRYFYFHLSEGTVKLELALTLQNSLFQAYYLNHWRYVGKTGHPIKPWKRPPVLTYSGGSESDSLWKEHFRQIERQWKGTGKVQEHVIVLFCILSTVSDHLVSGGRCTASKPVSCYFRIWHSFSLQFWLHFWGLNSGGTGKKWGEGLLQLRKIFKSTFNFVDWQMGQPVPFFILLSVMRGGKEEWVRRRQRQRKVKVH